MQRAAVRLLARPGPAGPKLREGGCAALPRHGRRRSGAATSRQQPEGRTEAPSGGDQLRHVQAAAQGPWAAFASRWNDTIARRPMPVVIFFSGTATLCWAAIFAALSCSTTAGSVLAAPEFAVGWLVMRLTTRLRMPANVAAAALVSGAFPALSSLKISPLLAVFVGDSEAQAAAQRARRRLEESPRLSPEMQQVVKRSIRAMVDLARWAEGPIDKYGLSYYLVARATSVSTLCGATAAAMHGLDVPAALSRWGLSGELQSDAGLFACAAAMNVPCMPLHFLGAVHAVRGLEQVASRIWIEKQRELEEVESQNGGLTEEEQGYKEISEADVAHNFVTNVAYLTLLFDLVFALWIMRRMSRSQSKADHAEQACPDTPACDGPAGEVAAEDGAGGALPSDGGSAEVEAPASTPGGASA